MYTYRIVHHRATEDTERPRGTGKHLKQEFAKIAEGSENFGPFECPLCGLCTANHLSFHEDFHEQRANQGEAGKLIRKPGGQEWKREDIQNSSSWFHGFLIKKRRSSPCLRDSVVMSVLVAAPPRCVLRL